MPSLSRCGATLIPGVHGHDDQALVLVRLVVAGVGQQADEVGTWRVGDPHLVAVNDVVIAVGPGVGLESRHVRAGTHFADADAADFFTGDGRAQEFLFLLGGAEAGQGGVHMSVCTPMDGGTPPAAAMPNSSAATRL